MRNNQWLIDYQDPLIVIARQPKFQRLLALGPTFQILGSHYKISNPASKWSYMIWRIKSLRSTAAISSLYEREMLRIYLRLGFERECLPFNFKNDQEWPSPCSATKKWNALVLTQVTEYVCPTDMFCQRYKYSTDSIQIQCRWDRNTVQIWYIKYNTNCVPSKYTGDEGEAKVRMENSTDLYSKYLWIINIYKINNFQTFFYPTFFFCNWILHIWSGFLSQISVKNVTFKFSYN